MNKKALFILTFLVFGLCSCSPTEEEEEVSKLRRMVQLEEAIPDSEQVADNQE